MAVRSDTHHHHGGHLTTITLDAFNDVRCDRILWHGDGIVQLSYIRGESRFSDHRPVCAVFRVEVGMLNSSLSKRLSTPNMKVGVEELLPPSNNYS